MLMTGDSRRISLDELRECHTPLATKTHCPIPHSRLRDLVVDSLAKRGLTVEKEEYAIRKGAGLPDAQLFGLLHLRNGADHPDYTLIAGLRNSHDKSITAGLALGSCVMVCDNMAFSGDVTFSRMHTSRILEDLPHRIMEAMNKIKALQERQVVRIEAYKGKRISDNAARVAIMKAATEGRSFISAQKTVKVWEQWKKPGHEAFKPRTVWSLFNGFTEIMKDYGLDDRVGRTQSLHAMMDEACNLVN